MEYYKKGGGSPRVDLLFNLCDLARLTSRRAWELRRWLLWAQCDYEYHLSTRCVGEVCVNCGIRRLYYSIIIFTLAARVGCALFVERAALTTNSELGGSTLSSDFR